VLSRQLFEKISRHPIGTSGILGGAATPTLQNTPKIRPRKKAQKRLTSTKSATTEIVAADT
jgi:hypothetical protein